MSTANHQTVAPVRASSSTVTRVLVVEDDPHDQLLMSMAAESSTHVLELSFADDGEAAMRSLLDGKAKLPDIIVLDLRMPRMSGHEVLAELRTDERLALMPVVVFSSSTWDKDVDLSLARGATRFVSKPAVFDELVAFVDDLVLLSADGVDWEHPGDDSLDLFGEPDDWTV
ncbi:MAG: response regulator [Actinomycetia bacterium]|nr:response regulator [Actinomycetes bacterium]